MLTGVNQQMLHLGISLQRRTERCDLYKIGAHPYCTYDFYGYFPIAILFDRFLFYAKDFQSNIMVAAELLQPGHLLRVFGAGGDQDLVERVPGINLLEMPAATEYRESVKAQPVKRRIVVDDSENPGGSLDFWAQ